MPVRLLWVVLTVLLLAPSDAASAPKPAKECPHPYFEREDIVKAIGKAPNCGGSVEIFEACQGGASGDVEFGDAVVEKCEAEFLSKLNVSQKRAYHAERKNCERKYIKQQGTMYRSFEAFCHAYVARNYARKHASPAPAQRR